ncbi:MAG TPA: hypothetical protein PK559_15285, partial [Ignavibacteriaceae bacterium]|nr:hypothetical protein [Ignavibacteriaceae bacterium]
MKVYHQTGFRDNWNRESYLNGTGDGLIYSPINIDADKLLGIDSTFRIRRRAAESVHRHLKPR